MSSRTVRIKPETLAKLRTLAKDAGQTLPQALDKAVDAMYRQQWLEGLAEDYAKLRSDKKAWAEELRERALWDNTLMDGLKDL
jgi:hypothetical protein